MSEAATPEGPSVDTVVSHEQDGRVLSGVGVSAEKLAETMERHAPKEPEQKTQAPMPDNGSSTPPVSRGRQRFSDLTRERDEAKAAREAAETARQAAERERDELRQRIETASSRREPEQPAAQPAQARTESEAPKPTRPEPTEDEIGTKYQTYAEFARDLAKWVVEQERASFDPAAQVREILAQERQREDFQSSLQSSQERARKAYPDFDTLLKQNGGIPLGRSKDEAMARVSFIARHPQSEHIQYAILKDAKLAESLGKSSDLEFGIAIAGLAAPAKTAPVSPAWTPPPPPHPTVGASTPTTTTPTSELARKGGYDFDSSGYRERRAAERKVKSRY